MRTRTALLATALLLATLPAPSVSASKERSHELVGRSKFVASSTSRTLVSFPRPVDFMNEFRTKYDGNGRVRGFILRKVGNYEQEGLRPVIESATIGRCKTRGCDARKDEFSFTVCFCDSRKLTGTWELYVLADGAPVTVVLGIKGLNGRQRIEVRERVRAQVQTLKPRVEESEGRTLMSAGDYSRLKDVDFGLVGLWMSGDPHLASSVGGCHYHDYREFGYPSVFPPEEVAFLPGCPTGEGSVYPHVDQDAGGGGVIFTSGGFGNEVGLGGWYQTAAVVKQRGAVVFWLDY